MNISRRIASTIAIITLVSTISAAPTAFAENCRAGVIGPYGTYCGPDSQADFQTFYVNSKFTAQFSLSNLFPFDSDPDMEDSLAQFIKSILNPTSNTKKQAVQFGTTILGGVPDSKTTKKTITPKENIPAEVVVVPGSPTKLTVKGFQAIGTRVLVMLQSSGKTEREDLGSLDPNADGSIVLPTTTLKAGDSATYTLTEWKTKKGKIDFSVGKKGIVTQKVVKITGTGVANS